MKKIFTIFFFTIFIQAYSYACCCYPSFSCINVDATTEKAKTENITHLNTEDDEIGSLWLDKVEKELKELQALKEISLEKQKQISNLEFANLIESYNEELNYLNILDMKKNEFDTNAVKNKLLLLESSLSIELKNIEGNFPDNSTIMDK